MIKPANCPICGKYPMVWAAERHDFCVKIECCDHCISTPLGVVKKWNQYAAAMELAKLEVEFENCKPEEEYQYQSIVTWAREHVLKVWK